MSRVRAGLHQNAPRTYARNFKCVAGKTPSPAWHALINRRRRQRRGCGQAGEKAGWVWTRRLPTLELPHAFYILIDNRLDKGDEKYPGMHDAVPLGEYANHPKSQ